MELVTAANSTSKKNSTPTAEPKPMLSNTLGRVMNIRDGPAFSEAESPPENANTAGMIIKPAIMAMRVSKNSTFWVESSMAMSRFM